MPDKRELPRIPCRLQVSRLDQSSSIGLVTDLTLDGVFISTQDFLPLNVVLPLVIGMPGRDADIHADAEIVRHSQGGMGLRFLHLSRKSSRNLRRGIAEMTDVFGHQATIKRLHESDEQSSHPIKSPSQILALLRDSYRRDIDFTIIPAARALRLHARLDRVGDDHLGFRSDRTSPLNLGEPVFALCTLDFVSYSFRSTVAAQDPQGFSLRCPGSIYFSERRSGQRALAPAGVILELPVPWQEGARVEHPVYDRSSNGLSFQMEAGQAHYLPGTPLPDAVMVEAGIRHPLVNCVVRNLNLVTPEDGTAAWLKVGISHGHEQGQLRVKQTAAAPQKNRGVLRQLSNWSQGVGVRTRILFQRRQAKSSTKSTKDELSVVRFPNTKKLQVVGLMNSSFGTTPKPRCPVVLIAPGFGGRKETFCGLAMTITQNFRRQNKEVVVLRIDGTNNLGESEKDPGCSAEGRHTLKHTMSGGLADLEGALHWIKNNRFVDPTEIILVSASFGAVAGRALLASEAGKDIKRWFVLMGAADAQGTLLHGSGNVDVYGNYLRGIKNGLVTIVGCVFDADYFCEDMHSMKIGGLEDSRRDMARVSAEVTWLLGKYDAFTDPRRVYDMMNVASSGKREVIEVASGHLPRTSEEAIAQFCLVTARIWSHLFRSEIQPNGPSRSRLALASQQEWQRVYNAPATSAEDYWRTYLLAGGDLGFDILNLAPDYREFVEQQVALVQCAGRRVLDLGAGTGNISEEVAKQRPSHLTSMDLVPEALERVKTKIPDDVPHTTVAGSADGGASVAIRRWLNGELKSIQDLAGRVPGLQHNHCKALEGSTSDQVHAALRGCAIDIDKLAQEENLSRQQAHIIREINLLVRLASGRVESGPGTALTLVEVGALHAGGRLPFPDAEFEVLVCSLVLSYFNYPADALSEMYRVLEPGGTLVLSSMVRDADSSKLYFDLIAHLETAAEKDLPGNHSRERLLDAARTFANNAAGLLRLEEEGAFRFYDGEELATACAQAGFEKIEVHRGFGNPSQAVIVRCQR